jgi:hypothetical protein
MMDSGIVGSARKSPSANGTEKAWLIAFL